jgi:aldehyde dehydrogenase (NAD+)
VVFAVALLAGSGQACVAGTRILVQESIREEFTERLTAAMAAFRVGDPFDPATMMGPPATRPHFERVMGYLDIAAQDGARTRTGGTRCGDRGFFVARPSWTRSPRTCGWCGRRSSGRSAR